MFNEIFVKRLKNLLPTCTSEFYQNNLLFPIKYD